MNDIPPEHVSAVNLLVASIRAAVKRDPTLPETMASVIRPVIAQRIDSVPVLAPLFTAPPSSITTTSISPPFSTMNPTPVLPFHVTRRLSAGGQVTYLTIGTPIYLSGTDISLEAARQLAHDLLAAVGDGVPVAGERWIVGMPFTAGVHIYVERNGVLVGFALNAINADHIVARHNASLGYVPLAPPVAAPTPAAVKGWTVISKADGFHNILNENGNLVTSLRSAVQAEEVARMHNLSVGYPPPPAPANDIWVDLVATATFDRQWETAQRQALAALIRKHAPTTS